MDRPRGTCKQILDSSRANKYGLEVRTQTNLDSPAKQIWARRANKSGIAGITSGTVVKRQFIFHKNHKTTQLPVVKLYFSEFLDFVRSEEVRNFTFWRKKYSNKPNQNEFSCHKSCKVWRKKMQSGQQSLSSLSTSERECWTKLNGNLSSLSESESRS